MLIHDRDEPFDLVSRSIARGLPVGIHAMGDQGIAVAIEAIERAEDARSRSADARPPTLKRHHRIEDCTLPSEDPLRRMEARAIVPVPQPVFLLAEGRLTSSMVPGP